ncbi:phenylacetate-CoA ligase [Anaerolineae bacterium]|nr:phenylacetate-CoA ligase [Anaerolineae bacterium]
MPRAKSVLLDRELARLVKHAYAHAPAIKKIFDDAQIKPGEIKRVADLERVPVTSKDKLARMQQENPPFGGFLAVKPRRLKHIFLSPGPLYEPHGAEKALVKTAGQVFKLAGFKRGDIALNTLSYHLVPAGLLLDAGLRAAGATVVPSGVGNTELQVKMMLDLRVTGYAGAPSFLMTIIKKAEEMGLNFKEKFVLRHALFTAEPYPPSLRQQFEGVYGLETLNAYATAELGFLAYDDETKTCLRFAEGVVVEIVDPQTGKRVGAREPGEVVVTTFNETYPIIRLGTGDMAIYADDSFQTMMLVGRVGEAVKVRGMFVHPNQLKLAMSKFPAIARVQGVVTRPDNVRDHFKIKVELAQPIGEPDVLSTSFANVVRDLCRVGVDQVEFISAGSLAADAKVMVDDRKWE